ncbi:MAG: DnaD domain protein [Erysipelotrichaceae bacterium]|nr:DnaD domain protein [Erysipelotrichaceae bacterium]
MLGKERYKTDIRCELSIEHLRSLVFFYAPLIGNDAVILYEYFVLRGSQLSFEEINDILTSLNISIDLFERDLELLNMYRLVKTLKQEDRYVLIFNEPMKMQEFIKDDILVREFIMKTSGNYYRSILSTMKSIDNYYGYEDITKVLSVNDLSKWSMANEKDLNDSINPIRYNYNTLFDINVFLKDISSLMFPLRYRTDEVLRTIATLADLYGISYDKMRSYVATAVNRSKEEFNLKELRYLCMNSRIDYQKVKENEYDVDCQTYLMNLQEGKEVTEYDKKILYNLAFKYHLNKSVINVLIQHTLKSCNNRLLENYIYPIAADFHRNDVNDPNRALDRLNEGRHRVKEEEQLPVYNDEDNVSISTDELDEILTMMGKK